MKERKKQLFDYEEYLHFQDLIIERIIKEVNNRAL